MIPKIIHYCWFGENPMPEEQIAYVAGWKRILPEYKINLWNENNFDINIVPFTSQVARAKKWGFIVDYIRAYAVYHNGGIYLDTDIELLKPFDENILQNTCFSGFEDEKHIAPGLIFAGKKGCCIAKEVMDFYAAYNFMKDNGKLNLTPSPKIFTDILLKYGLKQNNIYQELDVFTAYPTDFFAPKSNITGKLKITENTISIHHYEGSWVPKQERKYYAFKKKINSVFGIKLGIIISFPYFILMNVKNYGLKLGIGNVIKKVKNKV